jgi:hypothetical protein
MVQSIERFRVWETGAPSDWMANDLAGADLTGIEQKMVRRGGPDGDTLVERCGVIFRGIPVLEMRIIFPWMLPDNGMQPDRQIARLSSARLGRS